MIFWAICSPVHLHPLPRLVQTRGERGLGFVLICFLDREKERDSSRYRRTNFLN